MKIKSKKYHLLIIVLGLLAHPLTTYSQSVKVSEWGSTENEEKVLLYELINNNNLRVKVINYGATLISVETPDRNGASENITLHLGSFAEYEKGHPLFGSIVGRYANRIDTGGFTINEERYDLESVNQKTGVHTHGGKTGLQRQMWNTESTSEKISAAVTFTHSSPDGHEGFPGQVDIKVTYRLTNNNDLSIEYEASTNAPTHLNLTNHVYWNLNGAGSGDILDHKLTLKADETLSVDARKIPDGEYLSVSNTPFDFNSAKPLGLHIKDVEGGGYDHCYVLHKEKSILDPVLFARLESPSSGRVIEIQTTEPGVQLYTGNYLKPSLKSSDGLPYGPHHGICLETQRYPDSPNKPEFPSTLLLPGERYRQVTIFRFSVSE